VIIDLVYYLTFIYFYYYYFLINKGNDTDYNIIASEDNKISEID